MVQRRYGPVQGAGVGIIETEGQKPVEPGALGWVGYAGILDRGPTGELILCPSRAAFERKVGGRITASDLPRLCHDFFDRAQGKGGIALVRITDGTEVKAAANLFCRRTTQTKLGTLTAKNAGIWAGQHKVKQGQVTDEVADITATTIVTGVTMLLNEWKGGYAQLAGVGAKKYPILSNTTAGVVTVASDQDMEADLLAGGDATNDRYYLVLDEVSGGGLSFVIADGEENPDSEFSLALYLDGARVSYWPNLHTDPAHKRYWVNTINDDDSNEFVTAAATFSGAHVASVRPANVYGKIAAVTATVLTATIHEFSVTTGDANPTVALGTTTDDHRAQTLTLTVTGVVPATFSVVSDKHGAVGTGTAGSLFTSACKWVPPFTVTDGATALEVADVMKLVYKPLPLGLDNQLVYADKVNAKRTSFRVKSNTHKAITAADGSDMTTVAAIADEFMVVAPTNLEAGYDGVAGVGDSHYLQKAWNVDTSPFNRLEGKGLGLVKLATPGVTATAVQKAGIAYAAAKNHQYRYEIPSDKVTEQAADEYINDTLGRNDFAVTVFPSYVYVLDPDKDGALKLVSATGMVQGEEARIANAYGGYHKAAAGEDAILPAVSKLPTGDAILNEEYLNPKGINVLKKVKGNFVIWGDRTLWVDPAWKWKHQREQMSYYEHVLQESFGWIVFAINDSDNDGLALAALRSFFLPEWRPKRALRGNTFEEAARIKVDEEINTDAVRNAGETYAEVALKLADTVERFVIRIGRQGIFEAVA